MLAIALVPPPVRARLEALVAGAAEVHVARARAAGDRHPLTRRFHEARAILERGSGELPPAPALLDPYRTAIDVVAEGVPCEVDGVLRARWASPVHWGRRGRLTVVIDRCEKRARLGGANDEEVRYSVPEVRGTKFVDHYERRCLKVRAAAPGYTGRSNADGSVTVSTATQEVDAGCGMVKVGTKEVPNVVQVPKTARRDRIHNEWDVELRGSFVLEYRGQTTRVPYFDAIKHHYTYAAAIPDTPVGEIREGYQTTPEELVRMLGGRMEAPLQARFEALWKAELEAARTRAQAVAGLIDDEEEAWLHHVLLGGIANGPLAERTDAGPLEARYGATAAQIREAFGAVAGAPVVAEAMPAATPVETITAQPPNTWTYPELGGFHASLTPSLGARKIYTHATIGQLAMPEAVLSDGSVVAARDTTVVGIELGFAILSRARKKVWGLGIVDGAELAAGYPFVAAQYSLGVGWRWAGRIGVFAGVRPNVQLWFRDGLPAHTSVPPFARLELVTTLGNLTAEAVDFTLAGDRRRSAALIYSRGRRRNDWNNTKAPAFHASLRYDDLELDATFERGMPGMETTHEVSLASRAITIQIGFSK